jgi:two-component system CheB/CheR fusion protein
MFAPIDKKYRIYRKRATVSNVHPLPELPQPGRWQVRSLHLPDAPPPKASSLADLHRKTLVERHAPPSVLVNQDYDILHISGGAGRYLRFTEGEPSRNLLKIVEQTLRLEMRAVLFAVKQTGNRSESRPVRTRVNGDTPIVRLMAEPINANAEAEPFLMVIFHEVQEAVAPPAEKATTRPAEGDAERVVHQLEEELQGTRDHLRSTVEQYETSVEELKASNEELQAINEELRSATEELETSKEELQSVNEELTTVNNELKEKVDEVSRANSDMQNLMASTEIGTIFLNRALRIQLYTPRAQELFSVIPTDINRPLEHLTRKLDYDLLTEDAEHVLATLKTVEREVVSNDGRWYISRMVPYRTVEDHISGVVLTFVDITERKLAEQERERLLGELDRQSTLLQAVVRQMPIGIIIAEAPSGRMILGNEWGEQIWRHTFIEAGEAGDGDGYGEYKSFYASSRAYQPDEWPLARSIQKGEAVLNEEIEYERGDDTRGWISVNSAPIYAADGGIVAGVMTFYDITERRRITDELASIRDDLEARVTEHKQNMRQLMTSLEDERRRISRELHDHLGQQLTVLKLHLESLLSQSGFAALREQIEQTQAIVQTIDKDLDFLAWELRPSALDDLGLTAVLANFVQEWSANFNTRAEFHVSGLNDARLPADSEIMLYRIAQEALNNVAKHAQADSVEVMLERRGDQVVLIVADNGTGFDVKQASARGARRGLGMVSMRERAALIGGTLEIESQPGSGTTIYARVPFVLADKES